MILLKSQLVWVVESYIELERMQQKLFLLNNVETIYSPKISQFSRQECAVQMFCQFQVVLQLIGYASSLRKRHQKIILQHLNISDDDQK